MTDSLPVPRAYRLSDSERDEAISALGDAFAEGRLSAEEFATRMSAASEATFASDLDPLFADLPARRRAASARALPVRRRQAPPRGPAPLFALVPAIAIVMLALTVGPWILIPAFIILGKHRFHASAGGWQGSRAHGCHGQARSQGPRADFRHH